MAIIQDGITGYQAGVDANGNLKVNLPVTDSQAGFAAMLSENSTVDDLGGRTLLSPETSGDYRLRVGLDKSSFNCSFESPNSVNYWQYFQRFDTGTMISQIPTAGYYVLNSTNVTATSNSTVLKTYRTFPLFGSYATYVEFWGRAINPSQQDLAIEFGLGISPNFGVGGMTDGVFFRFTTSGLLKGVINYNGSETQSTNNFTLPASNEDHHYVIVLRNDAVNFWIDNELMEELSVPVAYPQPSCTMSLPLFARAYTGVAIPSATKRFEIGFINVSSGDMDTNKQWTHVQSGGGQGSYEFPIGSTASSSTSKNWTNNAAPAVITSFSNTNLPSPPTNYNMLGGNFAFNGVIGSPSNEYIVFGCQLPAAMATSTGKNLYITNAIVSTSMSTTVSTGTGMIFQWAIGHQGTALSLATADATTTKAARRALIGQQGLDAVATTYAPRNLPDCQRNFETPLFCPAGTFVQLILKIIGGTTASGVFIGSADLNGYWE